MVTAGRSLEHPKRYVSLDIVRGLAALSVFVTHWSGWTTKVATNRSVFDAIIDRGCDFLFSIFWRGGGIHPGVVFFIVLSGFCIHMPIAIRPHIEAEPSFLRRYAIRRFFRIVPMYWFATLLGIAAVLFAKAASPQVGFINSDVQPLAILAVVFGIVGIAKLAFPLVEFHPGNVPLATVASELVLYAIYPVLLWLRKRSVTLVFSLVAFAYCLYVALIWLGFPTAAAQGSFLPFLLYWFLGAAAVEIYAKGQSLQTLKTSAKITVATLVAFLIFSFAANFRGEHVVMTPLLAIHAAALLHTLMTAECVFRRKEFFIGALGSLGERSYSLYVVHTPVIALAIAATVSRTNTISLTMFRVIIAVLVLIATETVYRLIESPAHRLGIRRSRRVSEATTSSAAKLLVEV